MDKDNELIDGELPQEPTTDEKLPDLQHIVEPPEPGKVTTIMSIGSEDRMPQVMHTASIQMGSTTPDTSNMVKVRIKYPAKWGKPRFFKDGEEKEMAPETAAQFVKQGFASIITDKAGA